MEIQPGSDNLQKLFDILHRTRTRGFWRKSVFFPVFLKRGLAVICLAVGVFSGKTAEIFCKIHHYEQADEKNECPAQQGECLHLKKDITDPIGKGDQ